jgi:hypothetical protein
MTQPYQTESALWKNTASRPSWTCEQCSYPGPAILLLSNILRTEHANQVKKRQEDLKIPALVQSNAALTEPSQLPGMTYLNVNINGKGFERSLLWQLSTWSIM